MGEQVEFLHVRHLLDDVASEMTGGVTVEILLLLPVNAVPQLPEPEVADGCELRAAAEGMQAGTLVRIDVRRHVWPRLVVRVDVLLRGSDRCLMCDLLHHQLAEQSCL